jgi:hypothetical protein
VRAVIPSLARTARAAVGSRPADGIRQVADGPVGQRSGQLGQGDHAAYHEQSKPVGTPHGATGVEG